MVSATPLRGVLTFGLEGEVISALWSGVMKLLTDAELIAATLRGDSSAFRRFYDRHVDAVFARAMSILRNEDDVREITQETFALAFRKLKLLRLVDGSARPWLLRSCLNLVATRNRAVSRRPVTVDIADLENTMTDTESLESLIEAQLLLDYLRKEVAVMSFIDQEVFRLVLVEERSYEEASMALKISLASVRKRVNRVRSKLRTRSDGRRDE